MKQNGHVKESLRSFAVELPEEHKEFIVVTSGGDYETIRHGVWVWINGIMCDYRLPNILGWRPK